MHAKKNNNTDNAHNGKGQVPVYQGMTILNSRSTALTIKTTSIDVKSLRTSGGTDNKCHHNEWINGDYNGRNEDIDQENPFTEDESGKNIENEIKSTLDIIETGQKIYYATANEDIYINIHISNPDNYEIMSFTLNGKKYSSYMFENGSNMETLILKYNVGSKSGIQEYTIDAIKYIDGADIKDVIMDGEKTVLAGVRVDNQVNATVSNVTIKTNSLSFDVKIVDEDSLILYSQGWLKAVIYDGENIVATKDLTIGENVVFFDNLETSTLYQYAIVGYYDNLSGVGFSMNLLYKEACYTKAVVLFDNVVVSQESIQFTLIWDSESQNKLLTSLKLYRGNVLTELSVETTKVDDLLSDTIYKLIAEYKNGDNIESISLEFKTEAKATPVVEIASPTKTQTSVGFVIDETDVDNVGTISKIELVHANGTVVADSLNVREFTDLLSDNTYTIKLTYTYDLNDGVGLQEIVKTLDIKTETKAKPSVTFDILEQLNDSISGVTKICDNDNTIIKSKLTISNYLGEIEQIENTSSFDFEGLNCFQFDYDISLTLVYNLNDGKGKQQMLVSHYIPTLVNYSLLDDDTYSITGLANIDITELIIPETYREKTVSTIGSSAFKGSNITIAVLADTIKKIEDNAFSGCYNLSNVNMPTSIRHIGVDAFDGCNKIVNYIKDNITSDVVYNNNSKWYMLKNNIQIKHGATLTINEGVVLLGNNCDIVNYGTLNISGSKSDNVTLFNVNLLSKNAGDSSINNFNFTYANLHVGQFSPAGGGSSHSNINIDHCSFYDSTDYTYIWYPGECVIKNSYFENWFQISIGTRGRVSIMYNTFVNCGSYTGGVNSVIECWAAAYGDPIIVQYNNFINPKEYTLSLEYGSSRMDARYNWFGTSDEKEIKRLIWDGNDDFSIPNTIDYSGYLTDKYQS